jgi:16S rRNA (cytosine967-C5)-methyltransferase
LIERLLATFLMKQRLNGKSNSRKHLANTASPARLLAFEILRRVEESGAFASVLLAAREAELPANDRGLCHELVMGVLRHRLWLDRLIAHYANRDSERLDPAVRTVLRLGLYQLRLLTRIPASAAVNESVKLVRIARLRSADTLVNAVLRRATRESDFDPLIEITDAIERAAVQTSHPQWLIARWTKAFGIDETCLLAQANNTNPSLAFRVVHQRAAESEVIQLIRKAGAGVAASKLAPQAWLATGTTSVVRQLALEGVVYLQDEASQLIGHVLGAQEGERILDLCAAPGSKSTHIADLTNDRAFVVCGDVHAHRLLTLNRIAANQRLSSLHAVNLDGLNELPFAEQSFDRVLVDAPCSGTGTLQRNPEIRWRISVADIDEAARQFRLLVSASRMVKVGGQLVYSTCSVELEENERVVARFLEGGSGFRPMELAVNPALLCAPGAARIWPQRDKADGFFVAGFERLR